MSDRLRALRDDISHNTSPDSHHARAWLDALNTEIAEREAPPATREEALAAIATALRALHVELYGKSGWRQPGSLEIAKAAADIEFIARGTLRSATAEELLSVALDIAPDGEVSEALAKRIAALMPALLGHEAVRTAIEAAPLAGGWEIAGDVATGVAYRHSLQGDELSVTRVRTHPIDQSPNGAMWATYNEQGERRLWQDAPTLADAMRAADAALRADGRILIGGIPDEVLALVPVATATPGEFTTAPCLDCGGTGEVVPRESRYGAPVRCSVCGGAGTLPVPRRRVQP